MLNDTHKENLIQYNNLLKLDVFTQYTQFNYLTASHLLDVFTQYTQFNYTVLYSWCLNKVIYRVDRKIMAASLNMFYGKMWDCFVLTQENAFSWRFCFKANRKILWYPLKTVLGIFKTPPFKRSACFYVTDNHYVFWTFNTLTFNTLTLELLLFLQKLEYLLLVQRTNEWKRNISIQNCPSKAHVNTNWTGSTKWKGVLFR